MRYVFFFLALFFFTDYTSGQKVHITTFKHTVRWLNESNFPNYFIDHSTRDSIYSDIRENLGMVMSTVDIELPEQVEYKTIAGFGKPKNEPKSQIVPAGRVVEIYSFLTRATAGFDVFWGVKVVIKENGKIILDKEATCEIIDANTTSNRARVITAKEFRIIFSGLFAQAIGLENPVGNKIVVGKIEEKEKQVQLLFPDFEKYVLQVNGRMMSAGNFSSRLVRENDTIFEVKYRGIEKSKNTTPVRKQIFAKIFSELLNADINYTEHIKRTINGQMDFSDGFHVELLLEYIEEVTSSGANDEVVSNAINEPLIGKIFNQDSLTGEFYYQQIADTIKSSETKVKHNVLGEYMENSFGMAILHNVKGKILDIDFDVEYNELFSFIDIRIEGNIVVTMIMQNCNPKNSTEFSTEKSGSKKTFKADKKSLSLNNEYIQEWFPIYMKKDISEQEIILAYQMLVTLFFGIGKM